MLDGVIEREGQRSQRLSTAGGDGEREQAGRLLCGVAGMSKDVRPDAIDVRVGGKAREIGVEALPQPLQ
jgi:hypothetical protein